MSGRNAPSHPICRWCKTAVPARAAYCPHCGAHRDEQVRPCLQDHLDALQRRMRIYTGLFALVVGVGYYGSIFSAGFFLSHMSGAMLALLLVAVLGLLVYIGVRVEHSTRGIACPACREPLNDFLLKQDTSHCPVCGTRILSGRGRRLPSGKALSPLAGDNCGFCGGPMQPTDVYCPECGSNVAEPVAYTESRGRSRQERKARLSGKPLRLRCPVCRRRMLGVPVSRLRYCPSCGSGIKRATLPTPR